MIFSLFLSEDERHWLEKEITELAIFINWAEYG